MTTEYRVECVVGSERRWVSSRGSALTADYHDARVFDLAGAGVAASRLIRRGTDCVRVVATNNDPLTGHDIRAIAVHSETDPRTVQRYLRGDSVRHLSRKRIESALRELGREGLARE